MTELEPLNLGVHDWEGILSDCVILKSAADLIVDKARTCDCEIHEEVSVIISCHCISPSCFCLFAVQIFLPLPSLLLTASGETHYSDNKAQDSIGGSSAPSLEFADELFTSSC